MYARGLRKERDFALRMALGATRGALARRTLLEGLLLTCAAGAAGLLLLGAWGSGLMSRFAAASVAGGASLSFGPRAVALLACAALLAQSFANLRRVDAGFDARLPDRQEDDASS